jgi:hypothetical protein
MLPNQLHADMSRYRIRHEKSSRYMLNFGHMRGLTNVMMEQIEKHLNSKGCNMIWDHVEFVIKGGVRPRVWTYDLNTMRQAIEILKQDTKLTLTYRGKIAA